MSFDSNKFMRAVFEPRTADVPVPALADFFPPDTPPVWTVRGMTGAEIAKLMEANQHQRNIDTVIAAISSSSGQIDEIRSALGIGDDVPTELVKRLEQLEMASVNPTIDKPLAVKLAEQYPIEFYTLTNKITELTGLGANLKK